MGNDIDRDLLIMALILAGLVTLLVVVVAVERRALGPSPEGRTPNRSATPPTP